MNKQVRGASAWRVSIVSSKTYVCHEVNNLVLVGNAVVILVNVVKEIVGCIGEYDHAWKRMEADGVFSGRSKTTVANGEGIFNEYMCG